MSSQNSTLRVVQWATGKVGSRAMRAVIQHPHLELVGLYVHSAAKEGKDAGELIGLPATGIKATRSIDDVVALKPDCVLYMQEGANLDDICRLLEAGINIVTTRNEFFYAPKMRPEFRERVLAACQKGNSSLHATGSSPGFITEAIPVVLTSLARRVDCVTIDEYAYIPESCSPEMVFDVMGYGREATGEFDQGMLQHMAEGFEQSLTSTSVALGLEIDEVKAFGETANATSRIKIAEDAYIEPGTVAAQRITIAGIRNGKPLIQLRANWYCATELDREWELGDTGWRVNVEGDTPLDVRLNMPRTDEPVAEQMGGYTAHRAVNAIEAVCAASPGVKTTAELPQVIARLG
ncbi:dihydrodipicolinate reductase [Litorivivens sp.]|uniref:NAD(P)H-dependent amine dehydrogenase family protein n=1 Tax=Litorivivens sp. TaxID=2020868 RepID=UPI00356440FB